MVEEAIATRTRRDEGVFRRVSKESIALNEDREERFGDEFLKIGNWGEIVLRSASKS